MALPPAPARTAHRSASSALLLVAVVLLLVASTFLTSPAEAARKKRASKVTGWSTSEITAKPRSVVMLKVGVRPASRRVVRRVALQWRQDASSPWRTIATDRTDRRGRAAVGLRPVAGTVSEIRLAVRGTRRAHGFATAPRLIRTQGSGGQAKAAAVSTTTSLSGFEAEVLRLTNEARGQARRCGSEGRFAAAGPLRPQGALTQAGRAYANRMGKERFFGHTAPGGSTPTSRARAVGYTAGVGENIAAGQKTPSEVVAAWLASDGHCANIMRPGYTELGVAYRAVPGSPYTHYWVQMYGIAR